MNIPILIGSPHGKSSEVAVALNETAHELDRAGFRSKIFATSELSFAACAACLDCETTDECIVQDDIQMLQQQFLKASGLILASPVYLNGPPGRLKCLLDRFWYWMLRPRLFGKYAAVVVDSTSFGDAELANYLTSILESLGMQVIGPPILTPKISDDSERRKKMLIDCRLLGRRLAETIQKRKKIKLSPQGKKLITSIWNLIHENRNNYVRSHR
ncbi:MAG: flavodoxin family protein, partial [Promethearchaeota archaeon]